MYLFLDVLMKDCILLGDIQGVSGSICMSMEHRYSSRPSNKLVMSTWEGVGLCPKALDVKAFQSVVIAADCRDLSSWSWCCVIEGLGIWGEVAIECHLHRSYGWCPILIGQYGIGGRGGGYCVLCSGTRGIVCCLVLW